MPSVSEPPHLPDSPYSPYSPFDLSEDLGALGLTASYVETAFGKIFVARGAARGSDEVTLFLHGVGARWTTWTPLLRAAGPSLLHDAVLVDLPGFGASENRLGHLESLVVAAMLGDLVAGLGYRRARLVGHSMGGLLALDMAARPQSLEISSLHLAAGSGFAIIAAVNEPVRSMFTAPMPTSLFWTQYAIARSRAGKRVAATLHRRRLLGPALWALIAHPRRFPAGALAALVAEMAPDSFRHAAANLRGYDPQARWAELTVPVYAAFGAHDRFIGVPDQRTLARVYPTARSTVVADAAHFLHIERPHEVLAALGLA